MHELVCDRDRQLRVVTYLAPGLPVGLFRAVADALGRGTTLVVDDRASGPPPGEIDPFRRGTADIGFLCAPAYLALRRCATRSPVELLGLAPVFDDPRGAGRPVCFADVVVELNHPATSFDDLRGSRLGFNDTESLSGLLALALHLAARGEDLSFFASIVRTGSHHASLEALAAGAIDIATIDATTMRTERDHPLLARVRTIAVLGPHPVQPIVVRADLPLEVRAAVVSTLLAMNTEPDSRALLASFACLGFAPVDDDDYAELERRLVPILPSLHLLSEP